MASLAWIVARHRHLVTNHSRVLVRQERQITSLIFVLTPSSSVLTSQVRQAGHNKWSNIRHIKAEKDGEMAKRNKLYSNKINFVLKQTNNNTNLETNSSLKKVVEEALAQNVPKATVEKILKRGSRDEELCSEFVTELRGPGRVGIIVETLVKNRGLVPVKLNPIIRKHGTVEERGVINMFDKKGVIIAPMKTGASMDDAESDAIEAGAEEVTLIDEDEQILEFITLDTDFVQVKGSLVKAGYQCSQASISYIPNIEVSPSGLERKALEKLLEALMSEEIVTNVHCNAD